MAYFPFFIDLEQVPGLVVGGGQVALRKIEKLLDYGPALTVVAPEILPEIAAMPTVKTLRRAFLPADLDMTAFVIAATNCCVLNSEIARLCRQKRILVNAVDEKENCTFLFPALVKRGHLSIGISTGGASPSAAAYLKNEIAGLLPEQTQEILVFLETARPILKKRYESDKQMGASVLTALWQACLAKGGALSPHETEQWLCQYEKERRQE